MTRTFIILLLFMTVNLMQRNRCGSPNKAPAQDAAPELAKAYS